MTLPTVVICDSEEKSKQIISLVNNQPDLSLVETVGREAASEHVANLHPKLVWLELAPEPVEAIALLSELRGRNPATYFLVSYETLNADLVKATMQLGAIDYLDAQSWQEQLPEAISRMLAKEKVTQETGATAPTAVSASPIIQAADLSQIVPPYEAPLGESKTSEEIELTPPAWPVWVIPSLALILLLVFVIVLYVR